MNMKIARLSGLMMIAILAVGLMAASAAFAEPEFSPNGGQTVTATSGTAELSGNGGAIKVECAKSATVGGKVDSPTLVGGIVVHFLECTAKEGSASCSAKSSGAPAGNLILTNTLHGVLGLILPKLTGTTGVGLLLLPATGSTFVTLSTPCTSPATSAVSGNVVGEAEPIGISTTMGTLRFAGNPTNGHASVKDFDLSTGGLVKPKLEAYTTEAAEIAQYLVTFGVPTEIT
jgi:hypothetical protein